MVTFGMKGHSEDFCLSFDLVTDAESVGVIGLSVFLHDAQGRHGQSSNIRLQGVHCFQVTYGRILPREKHTHTHIYTNMLLKVSGHIVTILFFFYYVNTVKVCNLLS